MLLIVYGGKPHTSHVLLQTIPYKMWNLTSRETTWIAMNLINPLHCETHWTASVLRFRFHLIAQDVILPKRATGMRAHQACAKTFTVLFLIASERQGVCVFGPLLEPHAPRALLCPNKMWQRENVAALPVLNDKSFVRVYLCHVDTFIFVLTSQWRQAYVKKWQLKHTQSLSAVTEERRKISHCERWRDTDNVHCTSHCKAFTKEWLDTPSIPSKRRQYGMKCATEAQPHRYIRNARTCVIKWA